MSKQAPLPSLSRANDLAAGHATHPHMHARVAHMRMRTHMCMHMHMRMHPHMRTHTHSRHTHSFTHAHAHTDALAHARTQRTHAHTMRVQVRT